MLQTVSSRDTSHAVTMVYIQAHTFKNFPFLNKWKRNTLHMSLLATYTLFHLFILHISFSFVFFSPYVYNCLPSPPSVVLCSSTKHSSTDKSRYPQLRTCMYHTVWSPPFHMHALHSINLSAYSKRVSAYLSPTSFYHVPHIKLQGFYHSTNNCAHSTLPPHDVTLLTASQCHTKIGSLTHANELLLIHKYTHTTHLLSV